MTGRLTQYVALAADAVAALLLLPAALALAVFMMACAPVVRRSVRRQAAARNNRRPRRLLVLGYTTLADGTGKGNLTDYDLWFNPGNYYERVFVYVARADASSRQALTSAIQYRQDAVTVGRLGTRTSPSCLLLDWMRASSVSVRHVLHDRIDAIRVDGPHFNALVALTTRLVTGVPTLLFIEATWEKILPKQTYMRRWKQRVIPYWWRICYRSFDAYVGSPSNRPHFYEPLGIERARIWPYRRGVDVRLAERAGEAPLPAGLECRPRPWIVVVGRLHEEKLSGDAIGLASALRALQPIFTVIMVGDGPMRRDLDAEIGRLSLSDHFIFTGALPLDQVLSVMKASDVAFAPYGGTSNVETMLVGTPIVGYDNEPTRVTIFDGDTGLVVPDRDAVSAAAAVAKILQDKDLSDRLTVAALTYARRIYTPEAVDSVTTLPLEELYRAWTAGTRPPPSPLTGSGPATA